MRARHALLATAVAVCAGCASPAARAPVGGSPPAVLVKFRDTFAFPEGPVERDVVRILTTVAGEPVDLEAIVARVPGPTRRPIALVAHGSPPSLDDVHKSRAASFTGPALELARQGYVAVAFLRRGFGTSSGDIHDQIKRCHDTDFENLGDEAADEVRAVLSVVANESYADAGRVIMVGVSAGGFAALDLGASPPPGLAAIIDFAGGRGGHGVGPHADTVCNEEALVARTRAFGRAAKLPTLFVYSENDHFFAPLLARRMYAAWAEGGGPGTFVSAPAFGADGHHLFSDAGISIWRPYVVAFLREHQLPAATAPLADMRRKVDLAGSWSPSARDEIARYAHSTNFHEAFAASGDGHVVWRSGYDSAKEARAATLAACATEGRVCQILFTDHEAFPPKDPR